MLDYRSVTFGSLFFRGALSWRSEDMEDPPMWSSGHISRNLSHSPQEHVKANKPANKFPEANASGKKNKKTILQSSPSEFHWVKNHPQVPTLPWLDNLKSRALLDIISGFLWPPVRLWNSTMHHLGFGLKHSAGHRLNRNLTLEVKEPKTSLPSPSHQYCLVKMYMHTRNPNDPCFDWKGPCFGGWPSKIGVIWVLGIWTHWIVAIWNKWVICASGTDSTSVCSLNVHFQEIQQIKFRSLVYSVWHSTPSNQRALNSLHNLRKDVFPVN